uniref:FAM194 C-terminal domain-containing protein n=1 Tax=Anser brachyrhynchus TaxID=132585 RepID=A0A8B9BMZ0_9AVES
MEGCPARGEHRCYGPKGPRRNKGTIGQGDNKRPKTTNPQGHQGPEGCPGHLPTAGSLPAPGWPGAGWFPLLLSWMLLPRENDELTLPVAEESHLLNALQICLMDASCHGLAVTSPHQKYFPLGPFHQIPALLSQWKIEEKSRKTSTDLVWEEEPEGASSSFPEKWRENNKDVCWKTSAVISKKAPATDSPSARLTGSKPRESKGDSRRHEMEDEMTQTEWSYSDEPLAAGKDSVVVLLRDTEMFSEAEESKEPAETKEEAGAEEGEEDNQAEMCEQAACEPVALAQGSPRAESEEEPLSGGEEHEDDGTAALLHTDEETTVTEEPPARCTFCSTPEKPIPTVADLKEQPQEKLFCCRSYRKVFDTAIQDLMSEDEAEEETDAAPHANPLQAELRSSIKEKLLQQLDKGGFESYRELLQQYLRFVAWTRISFRLSKPNEYTARPKTVPSEKHQATPAPPEDLFEMDSDCAAEHLKLCRSPGPVRRCYSDGRTFFLLFPDGSGQVYYPSGNVALLITFTEEARFTYVILEDSRIILTPCTGTCFDQAGASQKHWSWHDLSHHVHSPPFQPITVKLNGHLTLKIVSQDQIHLWFTSNSNCIHFNVGARLKLKDPKTSHLLKGLESEEELFLQSRKIQLRSLLSKIEAVLQ